MISLESRVKCVGCGNIFRLGGSVRLPGQDPFVELVVFGWPKNIAQALQQAVCYRCQADSELRENGRVYTLLYVCSRRGLSVPKHLLSLSLPLKRKLEEPLVDFKCSVAQTKKALWSRRHKLRSLERLRTKREQTIKSMQKSPKSQGVSKEPKSRSSRKKARELSARERFVDPSLPFQAGRFELSYVVGLMAEDVRGPKRRRSDDVEMFSMERLVEYERFSRLVIRQHGPEVVDHPSRNVPEQPIRERPDLDDESMMQFIDCRLNDLCHGLFIQEEYHDLVAQKALEKAEELPQEADVQNRVAELAFSRADNVRKLRHEIESQALIFRAGRRHALLQEERENKQIQAKETGEVQLSDR